jgi:hypothetical protein
MAVSIGPLLQDLAIQVSPVAPVGRPPQPVAGAANLEIAADIAGPHIPRLDGFEGELGHPHIAGAIEQETIADLLRVGGNRADDELNGCQPEVPWSGARWVSPPENPRFAPAASEKRTSRAARIATKPLIRT